MTETIYYSLWSPIKYGRTYATDKAKVTTIDCSCKDNCGLYKKKQCSLLENYIYSYKCPYGTKKIEVGFTAKAQKYANWCREQNRKYDGITNDLKLSIDKMTIVGDYIFLPYKGFDNSKFAHDKKYFIKGENFIYQNIPEIVDSIDSNKRMIFLQHLKEEFEEIFDLVYAIYPEFAEKYTIEHQNNYIGRKAYLITLMPEVGTFNFGYSNISFTWDGHYLKTKSKNAIAISNMSFEELIIIPAKDTIVTITDNEQVTSITKFID